MSILKEVELINERLIEVRRKIHQNPELGFNETETAKLIMDRLDELGISYKSGFAKTGIIGKIEGKQPGKRLLIRADMDALPIQEANDVPYKSQNDGVMHACGHDGHVSCLLGVAEILQQKREEFDGTILLAFQPAEEVISLEFNDIPGGAGPMVRDGAIGDLNNPDIDAAIALHVNAITPVGKITLIEGASMGSSDTIYINIIGKGGHGSSPHLAVDPILIASQIYIGVQLFLSRRLPPIEPRVFTIGKVEAGTSHNIIPNSATMEGTFRTLNQEIREIIYDEVPKIIKSIAQTYGGDAEIKIDKGYPVGVNDPKIVKLFKESAAEIIGEDNVIMSSPILGAEDFFEFGLNGKIPVAMLYLGGGNPKKGFNFSNHSDHFDFDEEALKIGAAILITSALNYLKS